MAVKISRATGNWLTNGTWETVDSTSFSNTAETAHTVTTAFSGTRTVSFTPGAITVTGLAVKLAVRTGTTGTFSIHLALNSTHVEVAGTLVTINCSDFPVAATADLNGGWHFFKFGSPVTLSAATAYELECTTSSSNQISLFRDSTSGNVARCLSTNTTAAPGAGDDVIICGEYLSAGSSNSFTVTMNETSAATDYGSAPTAANSLIQPGIAVCNKGTLAWGTSAATNYNLKISNAIIVYSGGTYSMGASGSEMPRNSSATLLFDCGANVDYGFVCRNLSTANVFGLSRTSGKNVTVTLLNSDAAANATSLGVADDTGWLDNDVIVVTATTRTPTQTEIGALNGNAGASSLTVDGFGGTGGGVANAHSGTSPAQGEVVLLTRNVMIQGASISLQAYISVAATASFTSSWAEYKWLGSATSGKRGIDNSGTASFTFCSFHDWGVTSNGFVNANAATVVTSLVDCVIYSTLSGPSFPGNTASITYTRMIIVNLATQWTFSTNATITDLTVASIQSGGSLSFQLAPPALVIDGLNVHSCTSSGLSFSGFSANGCTFSNWKFWRNAGVGLSGGASSCVIDTLTCFGNTTSNFSFSGGSFTIIDGTFNGDTSFSTTNGIAATAGGDLRLIDCDFGTSSGILTTHTTGDLVVNTGGLSNKIYAWSTVFASGTEIAFSATSLNTAAVYSEDHDGSSGVKRIFTALGNMALETSITHSGSQSLKMTPSNATFRLESAGQSGGFKVAVASGASVTPSVYVYEDATYNGGRARLILKRNDAIGITADTVIDTRTGAADATWEQMTGTTATASADGVMEFVVDCNGTAGNVYVDSFTVS